MRKVKTAGPAVSCCPRSGKVRHPSRAGAKRHLRTLVGCYGYAGHIYRCPACAGWHVGSDRRGA